MNQSLFDELVGDLFSIDEAAASAKVSSATIRNWIRAGHLRVEKKGRVDRQSFEAFIGGREGQKRLTGRANKSRKDSHDHQSVSSDFFRLLEGAELDFSAISEEYQASLSESFRNAEGIYYTPEHLVADFLKIECSPPSDRTFLDPCCGSGNFIMRALALGFKPENIYAFDTDPVAVEITKKRIFQQTGYKSENVKHIDFLEDSIADNSLLFDYVYTNPPWGKKLDKVQKERFGLAFSAGNSVDTCSLFFFACLKRLRSGGELGLLLPDSFFNIATFERARAHALSLHVTSLIDYDRPFKGLVTKAFAIVLRNRSSNDTSSQVTCRGKAYSYARRISSFLENPKFIINFQTNPEDAAVIEHLFATPSITLSKNARWGLGIVTGNNEKFAKEKFSEGYIPVFRGPDISRQGLSAATCFIPSDLSQYQQVAPIDLYQAEVKLIYKFISSNLCFYCDREQRYVLNSLNMLVPNKGFPITPEQLCALLNSDVINWLFSRLFKTHKILRADLENIPIHAEYFRAGSKFTEDSYLEYLSLEREKNGTYRVKGKDY